MFRISLFLASPMFHLCYSSPADLASYMTSEFTASPSLLTIGTNFNTTHEGTPYPESKLSNYEDISYP